MIKEYLRKQIDYRNEGSIAQKTRAKRMKFFNDYFEDIFLRNKGVTSHIRILDIGGTPDYWKYLNFKYIKNVSIISLNLEVIEVPEDFKEIITSVKGTAINMCEFPDQSFDLVFSNSVIEHVGDYHDQMKMANEMKRIGVHGFLQTPNKFFLMEPHFLFPYFQLLPNRMKEELVFRFSLGYFKKAQDRNEAREIANSVQLLSICQLKRLFPWAKIYKEKWMGLTKSFVLNW